MSTRRKPRLFIYLDDTFTDTTADIVDRGKEGQGKLTDWVKDKKKNRLVDIPPQPKVDLPPQTSPNTCRVYDNCCAIYNTTNININIPKLPELPPRRLPKENDKQTTTKTPAGSSIPVNEAIKNKQFGKLIWNPYSKTEYSVKVYKDEGFSKLIKESEEKAQKNFTAWFEAQEFATNSQQKEYLEEKKKLLHGTALIFPDSSLGGKLALTFGIDSTLLLADNYRLRAASALMPPCDFFVTKYKKEEMAKVKPREYPDTNELEFLGENTLYHRAGYNGLPATVPHSLLKAEKEDEKTIQIESALSLAVWEILQLDGAFGEFPIKIKYKNAQGKEEDINLPNIAEALAELTGICLNAANDANIGLSIGMRGLTESIRTFNTALLALDHIQAQTDYMGFKGREYSRKVKYAINPFAKNLRDSLKESEQDFIGYKIDDTEDLQKQLRTITLSAEIIRASLYHPFGKSSKDPVTGDNIVEEKKKRAKKDDKDWEELKSNIENPVGQKKVNDLKPKIQDITKPPTNQP